NGAKVHSGFKKSYLSVAQPIEGMVKSLLAAHEDFKVVFVGHSLGGAEASLAAADFVAKNSNYIGKVSLYTYGQPRTGNAAFAQWMDNQRFPKFRTTYRGDIVSQIPPRPLGYQHHGQEIFYPMSGALKFC
ncbi:alpha/beta-hydrolase, partial [Martensiomyces pterosporus]